MGIYRRSCPIAGRRAAAFGLPNTRLQQHPRRQTYRDLAEGVVFVMGNALLRSVFITQLIFATAFFMLMAVYIPYAAEHLGLGAQAIGRTLAAYGAGMLAGAMLSGYIARRVRFGTLVAIGPVSAFIASMMMLMTVELPSVYLAGASFFVMGAGPILWVISTTTLRQNITPSALLGQVSAINVLAHGARPLGAALGALVGGARLGRRLAWH